MRIAMFIKMGPKFQCLKRIVPEFQRLQGKDEIGIPVFVRIGPEFR